MQKHAGIRGGDRFYMVNTFGEWIKQKRIASGMSQEELGAKIDLTRQQIGRIESGEQTTRNATAVRLSDALGADSHEGMAFLVATQTGGANISDEMIRVSDPEDVHTFAMYDGLDAPDKEIARTMIAGLAKANRKKSIGGGND